MTARPARVVVVGGGVAGLAAAHRLLRPGPEGGAPAAEVTVLEASARVGGKVASMDVGDVAVEAGADSLLARKPWGVNLVRALGLADELVEPGASGAFVWARDQLVSYPKAAPFGVPADPEELLRWPGLSRRGRMRALVEVYRPRRRGEADESIGSLAERRLGHECAEILVEPLLSGIHAGDASRLSVRATVPELAAWERSHGSLLRGARAARRRARSAGGGGGAMFVWLRGGLDRLTETLADAVGRDRVETSTPVTAVRPGSPGGEAAWEVEAGGRVRPADAVVLAVPAFDAARLLGAAAPGAVAELAAIPYASTATVALLYPEGTANSLPDATGFIVPAGSRIGGRDAAITACTWISRKWPSPAFGTRAVIRAFVGRANDEAALALSDPELVAAVVRDVEGVSPIGERPAAAAVTRWDRAMPQYEVGHLDRVDRIEAVLAREAPGVFVCGSPYRGIGIPDCVRQGGEVAEAVRRHLAAGSSGAEAAS